MLQNSFKNSKISDEDLMVSEEKQFSEAVPIIKKTWKELMSNQSEVGERIYQEVLTKEVSLSRLFMNVNIDVQKILFMTMLDVVVGYLDDRKTMDKKLEELGRIHAHNYGVKAKHYKHFRTAFMKAVRVYIPWNNRRENAWMWFWDHIIAVMSIYARDQNISSSFNLPRDTSIRYVSAIRESFNNVIDKSPLEFVKQFHGLLLNERPDIANLFLPTSESERKYYDARFIAMLRYTIGLLDDQQEFQKNIISLTIKYDNCGINENQLKVLAQIFIRALKQANNHQWKSIHDKSWQWLLQFVDEILNIHSQNPKLNK